MYHEFHKSSHTHTHTHTRTFECSPTVIENTQQQQHTALSDSLQATNSPTVSSTVAYTLAKQFYSVVRELFYCVYRAGNSFVTFEHFDGVVCFCNFDRSVLELVNDRETLTQFYCLDFASTHKQNKTR